ncbi:MAG: tetratricopeptide repeat protein, partial [Nitrospirales bacterium]
AVSGGLLTSGEASERTWETLNAEGIKAYQEGRHVQAIESFRDALSMVANEKGPDPRQAAILTNLAAAHEELENFQEAELRYQQSLTIVESIQGPTHPDLLPGLKNLANLHRLRDQLAQAERLYGRSLMILERVLGKEHPHLIPSLLDVARVCLGQEEYQRSEEYYVRALEIGKAKLSPAHPQTQSIRMQFAALLRHLNRLDEADALEEQARHALTSPQQDLTDE